MPALAAIEVFIPEQLRQYCGNTRTLVSSGGTVGAVLAEIEREHPALYVNVCDETSAVRKHINIFVNDEHMREVNGLETTLTSGDIVTILPAVSGG